MTVAAGALGLLGVGFAAGNAQLLPAERPLPEVELAVTPTKPTFMPMEPPVEVPPLCQAPAPNPVRTRRKATLSTAGAAMLAAATCTGTGCPPHIVKTGLKTGDCTLAGPPIREIKGHPLPQFLYGLFSSLDGKWCRGDPDDRSGDSCWKTPGPLCPWEPCPYGDGDIVYRIHEHTRNTPDKFFWGGVLRGKARYVAGPEENVYINKEPLANIVGRQLALFTELELKDGTKVPICGVLFYHSLREPQEGIAVLTQEEERTGKWPASGHLWDYEKGAGLIVHVGKIKLFWPQ